jgi:hypothetical protein
MIDTVMGKITGIKGVVTSKEVRVNDTTRL